MSIESIIINLVISIIVALLVFEYKEKRNSKKKLNDEKFVIFKYLMATRQVNRDYEKVKKLNSIQVVYAKDKKVIEAYEKYIGSLDIYEEDEKKIKLLISKADDNFIALLEEMCKVLKVSGVDWKKIKKAYNPLWLSKHEQGYDAYNSRMINGKTEEYVKEMCETIKETLDSTEVLKKLKSNTK